MFDTNMENCLRGEWVMSTKINHQRFHAELRSSENKDTIKVSDFRTFYNIACATVVSWDMRMQ